MRSVVAEDRVIDIPELGIALNPVLIDRMGIGPLTIARLRDSHVQKLRLMRLMEDARTQGELLALAREIDGIEFYQQSLWGFPLDPLFHLWFEVPCCTCCKAAGEAFRGRSPLRRIAVDCPVHAQLVPRGTAVRGFGVTDGAAVISVQPPPEEWEIDTSDPVLGPPVLHFRLPDQARFVHHVS